tara:strand:- start:12532 stop:13032 length:501 start_codon:yes stop_codon:yes gene_type:complete
MRNSIPRYIYRGESLDDIQKHGQLTFNYDAEYVAKQLTASSDVYTASSTDIKSSDTLDFLLLESVHVNGTGHRQTSGYLAFTASLDRAKWYATNQSYEKGRVFKIDTHKLPNEQFRISKLAEQVTHKNNKDVINLMRSDEELSVFATKNAKIIPDEAISEIIDVCN